jgi:hypothetical protein
MWGEYQKRRAEQPAAEQQSRLSKGWDSDSDDED